MGAAQVHVAAVGAHIVGIPAMVAALEPAQCASILGGYVPLHFMPPLPPHPPFCFCIYFLCFLI